MYVCICAAVTDEQITAACDGCSFADMCKKTGCCQNCRRCEDCAWQCYCRVEENNERDTEPEPR